MRARKPVTLGATNRLTELAPADTLALSGGLIDDPALLLQASTANGTQAYFAVNKNGGYGLLVGYDAISNAAQVRQVATDPLDFLVNSTTRAVRITSDGNAALGYNLSVAGTTTLSTALGLASGGTGAATAAGALSTLGAYPASNPSGYIAASGAPVQSVAGRTGAVTLAVADVSGAAPINSPNFGGNTFSFANNTTANFVQFEIGSLSTAGFVYADWHSSGTNNDFDVRLSASGGTATPGQGTFQVQASQFLFNGAAVLNAGQPVTIAQGGTGAGTAAGARTALGLAAVASSGSYGDLTGAINNTPVGTTTASTGAFTAVTATTVNVGSGSIVNPALPVQVNAANGTQAYFAANKNGGYGLLVGYDAISNAAQVRQTVSDPLNFLVNSTTLALSLTPDGNASFSGTVAAPLVQFPSTVGAKLNLWGTAYGLGIQPSEFSLYSAGTWAFRQNGSSGTIVASLSNAGALTLGTPLAISQGGSGANTAAGALSTLGAYPASNPSGYIAASGAPVQSVAGRTGAVTLAVADVSGAYASSNPSGYIASAGAPVQSVAGRTGAVTLAVADVSGAAPLASPAFSGTVTAPAVTATTVGSLGMLSGANWQTQGGYTGWNLSGGSGEMDFINSRGGGGGGFNWYNVASVANAVPALVMSINNTGALVLSTPLAVTSGGTGATTAGGALTSLGAYASSNPAGYIAASGAPVQSVAGRTGAVTLAVADVSGAYASSNPAGYIAASGAPVQSVAGRTGTINLAVGDVAGAASLTGPTFAGSYNVSASGYTQCSTTLTSGGTDEKIWDTISSTNGKTLQFRLVNDAYTAANDWLYVNRTGFAPTTVGIIGQTISLTGTTTLSTPLALGSGGTGATTAAGARTALGLATVASSGSYGDLSNTPAIPAASTATPLADGSGTPGTSAAYAREGHVHPTDTSRYAASNPAGYIAFAGAPVQSVAGRTGTVTLAVADVSGALSASAAAATYAPLNGPTFTGAVTLGSNGTAPINIGTTGQYLGSNAQYNNGFKYIASDYAWWWRADGATGVSFHVAPSGTAGAAITDAIAINVSPAGQVTLPVSPLGLASGGTGAATAAGALANLGAYASSNPSGYITSAQAPVQSVAGRTGAVTLAVADVSGAAPLASPSFSGTAAANVLNAQTLGAVGALSGANWQTQGGYYGWNLTGGGGETDFVNSRGGGAGGFNWYNVASMANAAAALVMSLSSAGALTLTTALAVSSGGTGATTAAGALSSLGAYAASNPSGYIAASGAPVQSVAGRTGAVALAVADVSGALSATTAAATYAPISNPAITGSLSVAATRINDANLPLQINAPAGGAAYIGANKSGGYGLLVGYDQSFGGAVVRQVTTDPLIVMVNGTTTALTITSNTAAAFTGPVSAPDLNVAGSGTLAGAWTSYTATVTAGSGTVGTSSATIRYKKLGRTVWFNVAATVAAGSGGGAVNISLPFTNGTAPVMLVSRDLSSLNLVSGYIAGGGVSFGINSVSSGGYPVPTGGSAQFAFSGTYEASA